MSNEWTVCEDEQIQKQYPKTPILPGRAPNDIRSRGRELGLTYPDVYGDTGAELEDYSGRKYVTLWWYADKHGVTVREAAEHYASEGGRRKDSWLAREDEILRANADRGSDYIASLLPGRGVSAVRKRAAKIGVSLGSWTEEKLKLLCTLYLQDDDKALSAAFPEYKLTSLKRKAQKLGACRSMCLSLIKRGEVRHAASFGDYVLLQCATCKRTVLLGKDEFAEFTHSSTCIDREFEIIGENITDSELRYKLSLWEECSV